MAGEYEAKRSIPNYFVSFEFPDGSEKEFKEFYVSNLKFFKALQEDVTETLSYKEKTNATKIRHRKFVSFEKDP